MPVTTDATAHPSGDRRLERWDPEDHEFWERTGRHVARRNLLFSVLSEHVGFSVWSVWSVMVLFMTPEIGFHFTSGEKFLLVCTPTLVGALLRLPYSGWVCRFGGRNWTVAATAVLLVPTLLAAILVQRPETPFWVFLVVAAVAGVGGGNFASSMTNINAFYPERHKGWALGLNAGGGNLGVAAVQLVGLAVISVAGSTSPAYVAAVYLPVIVLVTLACAVRMDNLPGLRADRDAQREAVREPHTWLISLLYVGTFGSFIGYGFAFGLVLQTQFGFSAVEAASLTFVGPLLGSLSRPVGGWLSDRFDAALVTFWTFLAMAAGTGLLVLASSQGSFRLFIGAFTVLFVLTGVGNGSTYKMIPVVFRARATSRAPGAAPGTEARWVRRITGAVIGIAGAVGALGGVLINLAFRAAYGGEAGTGTGAFLSFLAFYGLCVLVTWVVYLRAPRTRNGALAPERGAPAAVGGGA
ncbi:MFS transporter [Actinoalloteichus sp. AHMU CJ021]|uniref:MFS transporter n=1 Tax=Actinoalloteichus sp. AHMU CJ021 TaxID=2072503 RepID=UPI000CA04FAF|nr:MFS transporter [Actinoalloteichus sp. AHMU CJ021]